MDYFGITTVVVKTDSDRITLYSLNQAELFRDDFNNRQRDYLMNINSSKQVKLLEEILETLKENK